MIHYSRSCSSGVQGEYQTLKTGGFRGVHLIAVNLFNGLLTKQMQMKRITMRSLPKRDMSHKKQYVVTECFVNSSICSYGNAGRSLVSMATRLLISGRRIPCWRHLMPPLIHQEKLDISETKSKAELLQTPDKCLVTEESLTKDCLWRLILAVSAPWTEIASPATAGHLNHHTLCKLYFNFCVFIY